MKKLLAMVAVLCGVLLVTPASAQEVSVSGAWVRATVPEQSATAAYMTLHSNGGARIVGVKAHVAGVAGVHEMIANGSVMTMRPLAALDLPAQKDVVLAPGGLHIMLQDLHHALLAGEHVQLVLDIQLPNGQTRQQFVDAEVRSSPPN